MTSEVHSRSLFPKVTIDPSLSFSRASRRTPCRFDPSERRSIHTHALRQIVRQKARAPQRRFPRVTQTRLCMKCGMWVASLPCCAPLEVFSGDMEYPGISRIPPSDATVHPALHRSWVIHQRGGRFVGVRSPVRICALCLPHTSPLLLTRLDTKSANGGRLLSQRHTISSVTRRCIPSTVSLTKSASD
jgi:hypothetical protein